MTHRSAPPADGLALPDILDAAWSRLALGAGDPAQDWHWPVLASVDARGEAGPGPDARVVVLRRADRHARELEIHSDARAHKLSQLRAAPRACLVFHDRAGQVQLRTWAHAAVHAGDAIARRGWDRLAVSSRRSYLAPRTPGEPTDAPDPNLPEAVRDRLPDAAQAEPGFAAFAAVVLRVYRLEWLHLDRSGHQRARFEWADDAAAPTMRWIRP